MIIVLVEMVELALVREATQWRLSRETDVPDARSQLEKELHAMTERIRTWIDADSDVLMDQLDHLHEPDQIADEDLFDLEWDDALLLYYIHACRRRHPSLQHQRRLEDVYLVHGDDQLVAFEFL